MKKHLVGLSLILLSVSGFAQQEETNINIKLGQNHQYSDFSLVISLGYKTPKSALDNGFNKTLFNSDAALDGELKTNKVHTLNYRTNAFVSSEQSGIYTKDTQSDNFLSRNITSAYNLDFSNHLVQERLHSNIINTSDNFYDINRRNIYSGLWAFASLNYLYADLVGLMDKNILSQYQSGVVNGTKITPNFLTAAAGFMQIPLANVFLPQVIKNERTLKWVQIASGTIMTLVQAGTLFVGKPTPYYVVFSAFEIGTTAYITFDAIKWKPKKNSKIWE